MIKVNFKIIALVIFLTAVYLIYRSFSVKEEPPNPGKVSFGNAIPCTDCNLIIISIDPLRVKNMSLYGYERKTTPKLDSFAGEALVFNNFVSVSPWTLPAHMSLFTGVYPSKHKILNKIGLTKSGEEFENNLQKVSPGIKTLTQILKENGYTTAGYTGGAADAGSFGFKEGFDVYTDEGDFAGVDRNLAKAAEWLKSNSNKKFFLFLQGYDVHGQYVPEKGYDKHFVDFDYKGKLNGSKAEQKDLREEGITRGNIFLTAEDVRFYKDLYDEKILSMDEKIGGFLEDLKKLGLFDKTIIIFTSGHGEEFYEHGRIDHGHSLYEELVHVPLIIRIPGFAKKLVLEGQYSILDLMPTVFDILGKSELKSNDLDGNSIIEMLEKGEEVPEVFLETDYRYSVFKRGIRTSDGWKIIKDTEKGDVQLFNYKSDPEEKNDLSGSNKEKLNQLLQVLNSKLTEY